MARSAMMSLFLLISMFGVIGFYSETVSAQTVTVDNTGGAMYTTIKDALNAATPGDTITVAYGTGTYNEDTSSGPLSFNYPLYVIGLMNGQGQVPAVVGSNSNDHVFELGANAYPAQIENFRISGATQTGKAGIHSAAQATYDNYVLFQNLRLTLNFDGIQLAATSSYHNILDCHVCYNYGNGIQMEGASHTVDSCGGTFAVNTGIFGNDLDGIYSSWSYGCTIIDSNIYSNDGDGIWICGDSNVVENVEIWKNGDHGLYMNGYSNIMDGDGNRNIYDNRLNYIYQQGVMGSHVFIGGSGTIRDYMVSQDSNYDSDGEIGISCWTSEYPYIDVEDCEVFYFQGDETEGVFLSQNNMVTGSNTKIHDCTIGVYALVSSLVDCEQSTFTYDDYQYWTTLQNIYSIDENDINEVGYGIYVVGDDVIIENTFFKGCHVGISTWSSGQNSDLYVDNCYFLQNDKGIVLDTVYDSAIDDSIFSGNNDCGICIVEGHDNTIDRSLFVNGGAGIYIDTDSYYNIITDCDFEDQYQTGYTAGVYIDGGHSNEVIDSEFDHCSWGVKIIGDGSSTGSSNIVNNCDFTDIDEEPLGDDVGIYCEALNFPTYLYENDFYNLSCAIHLAGAKGVDINGDSSSYSTIYQCTYVLYAEPHIGVGCESGQMTYYDLDCGTGGTMIIYLEGASGSTTDFTDHNNISGTLGTDYTVNIVGNYAYW